MADKGLTLMWRPDGHDGKALVTATLDGKSIAEATIDLSDKAAGDRFAQQVVAALPGIDPKQVEAELQRIAAEIEETTAIPTVSDRRVTQGRS